MAYKFSEIKIIIIINNFSRGDSRHMEWFSGRSSNKTNYKVKNHVKKVKI